MIEVFAALDVTSTFMCRVTSCKRLLSTFQCRASAEPYVTIHNVYLLLSCRARDLICVLACTIAASLQGALCNIMARSPQILWLPALLCYRQRSTRPAHLYEMLANQMKIR